MSNSKSIIIVGAGIAGLATGCYAQMNGYRTRIFELHTQPGGLCTAWKRRGFTFDGCIHWLVGSNPKAASNRLWRELGVAQGRPFVEHDLFVRYEEAGGKALNLYTDPDRLEAHLKELAPADARLIEEFTGAIRALGRLDMPIDAPEGLSAIGAGLGMLRLVPMMRKYGQITVADFFARASDPFMQTAIPRLWGLPEMPVLTPIMALAMMHQRNAGYPIGGSLAFSQAMEARYRALGGSVQYDARVAKILVEKDAAVGVRLADGSEHRADIVISAADGHATIFDMLEGRYTDDTVREPYEHWPIFQPMIQVSLGVNRDLSSEPRVVTWTLPEPVVIGGESRSQVGYRHLCYDPTMAPAGKSVVLGAFTSNYAFWQEVAAEPEHYEAEKQHAAITYIDLLDRRFPGIADQVEAVDVATPLTWERYTGNWQGSVEGWMFTKDTMKYAFGAGMSKTLPGLGNFYMVGQWVEPGGGVPTSAISARKLVKRLCKQDGKKFTTTEA
jgi:phytoene dehydrogenase-like protein